MSLPRLSAAAFPLRYTCGMEGELNGRHRQVLELEKLRSARGYKEGWLYYVCRHRGLLAEMQELQVAGLLGDDAESIGAGGVGDLGDVSSGEDGAAVTPRAVLTVELVPSTCWFSSLRSELSKDDWDFLRRPVFERAGNRCEVCGGRGSAHPVECHEIWDYDDERHVQRVAGLVALCPACHEAKHIGFASTKGGSGRARARIARLNGWSMDDVELYLESQFELWARRSQHAWSLDLSWLRQFGIDISPKRPDERK